jgi:hypothetical protein
VGFIAWDRILQKYFGFEKSTKKKISYTDSDIEKTSLI